MVLALVLTYVLKFLGVLLGYHRDAGRRCVPTVLKSPFWKLARDGCMGVQMVPGDSSAFISGYFSILGGRRDDNGRTQYLQRSRGSTAAARTRDQSIFAWGGRGMLVFGLGVVVPFGWLAKLYAVEQGDRSYAESSLVGNRYRTAATTRIGYALCAAFPVHCAGVTARLRAFCCLYGVRLPRAFVQHRLYGSKYAVYGVAAL